MLVSLHMVKRKCIAFCVVCLCAFPLVLKLYLEFVLVRPLLILIKMCFFCYFHVNLQWIWKNAHNGRRSRC